LHSVTEGGHDDTQEDKTNEEAKKTELDSQQQAVTTERYEAHSDDAK
jgi:hypothetical protein